MVSSSALSPGQGSSSPVLILPRPSLPLTSNPPPLPRCIAFLHRSPRLCRAPAQRPASKGHSLTSRPHLPRPASSAVKHACHFLYVLHPSCRSAGKGSGFRLLIVWPTCCWSTSVAVLETLQPATSLRIPPSSSPLLFAHSDLILWKAPPFPWTHTPFLTNSCFLLIRLPLMLPPLWGLPFL